MLGDFFKVLLVISKIEQNLLCLFSSALSQKAMEKENLNKNEKKNLYRLMLLFAIVVEKTCFYINPSKTNTPLNRKDLYSFLWVSLETISKTDFHAVFSRNLRNLSLGAE